MTNTTAEATYSFYTKDRQQKLNVEIKLDYTKEDKPVFTASGVLYEKNQFGRYKDIEADQCLDIIPEFAKTTSSQDRDILLEIYRLWKLHHLNDLHAGTPRQEEALEEFGGVNANEYQKQCEMLERWGLLIDQGYKFGSGWLYKAIPTNDLKSIKKLLTV